MLAKLERLGCDKTVVCMVLPTGYTFDADGTSIYLSMAAVFVAQVTNTDLSIADQVVLLGRPAAFGTMLGHARPSGSWNQPMDWREPGRQANSGDGD